MNISSYLRTIFIGACTMLTANCSDAATAPKDNAASQAVTEIRQKILAYAEAHKGETAGPDAVAKAQLAFDGIVQPYLANPKIVHTFDPNNCATQPPSGIIVLPGDVTVKKDCPVRILSNNQNDNVVLYGANHSMTSATGLLNIVEIVSGKSPMIINVKFKSGSTDPLVPYATLKIGNDHDATSDAAIFGSTFEAIAPNDKGHRSVYGYNLFTGAGATPYTHGDSARLVQNVSLNSFPVALSVGANFGNYEHNLLTGGAGSNDAVSIGAAPKTPLIGNIFRGNVITDFKNGSAFAVQGSHKNMTFDSTTVERTVVAFNGGAGFALENSSFSNNKAYKGVVFMFVFQPSLIPNIGFDNVKDLTLRNNLFRDNIGGVIGSDFEFSQTSDSLKSEIPAENTTNNLFVGNNLGSFIFLPSSGWTDGGGNCLSFYTCPLPTAYSTPVANAFNVIAMRTGTFKDLQTQFSSVQLRAALSTVPAFIISDLSP
jgi:hypothetical protein